MMLVDENPMRVPISKVKRRRPHPERPTAQAAPWSPAESPEAKRQGLRYVPEVLMESPQHWYDRTGRQRTVYYSPNTGDRGVRRGYPNDLQSALDEADRPTGVRYVESGHAVTLFDDPGRASMRRVRPLQSTPCIPFQDGVPHAGLETPDGRIRGRSHSHSLRDSGVLPGSRWALMGGVAALPPGGGGDGVRRRPHSAGAAPRRCPFGTEYETDPHRSLRQLCVHYDTRDLLTAAA